MAAYRPAILSASLGRAAQHSFDNKISQAASHGFEAIEVFYEDIEYLAKELAKTTDSPTEDQILHATKHIRTICDSLNLTVLGLQPFLFYEGLLDREQHARLIVKIQLWFRLAKTLGTNTIQIPANFLPAEQLTGNIEIIIGDLRQLADLGLAQNPPICFAYENLCWSTHADTWEKAWNVVKLVDRENFGICLDTFNIAGRVWGDPASPTGKTANADTDFAESMARMVKEVDVKKVFYIQVVDAEKMERPLVKGHPFHVDVQPARMSWSRNARTFMYEEDRGAYLPAEDVAKAIIDGLGYKGFVSMELFSRTMSEEGEHVPEEHARRGIEAWKKFEVRMGLNGKK